MEHRKIKVSREGKVGVITFADPPANPISIRLMLECLDVMDQFEQDDSVRCLYVRHEGPDFAIGAGDADEDLPSDQKVMDYSELGGRFVQRIDEYPKPTIVAAKGMVVGGGTAIYNAFDIRIAGSSFRIKDADIFYGNVGSMGMSSLRLPIWIGRNRTMDYMFMKSFLDEGWTGEEAHDLGLVSLAVDDSELEKTGMYYAQKMSTAAPIAVRRYKECVRRAVYSDMDARRAFEAEAAKEVAATEDAQRGLEAACRLEQAEFYNC